jgi:hypothetical protein
MCKSSDGPMKYGDAADLEYTSGSTLQQFHWQGRLWNAPIKTNKVNVFFLEGQFQWTKWIDFTNSYRMLYPNLQWFIGPWLDRNLPAPSTWATLGFVRWAPLTTWALKPAAWASTPKPVTSGPWDVRLADGGSMVKRCEKIFPYLVT